MAIENKTLVLDLLEWVGTQPRPYDEVMAAWRTSCPRLPVWEDAVDAGFVSCSPGEEYMSVRVTATGQRFLETARPSRASATQAAEIGRRAHV
jgi:hypothetical protein